MCGIIGEYSKTKTAEELKARRDELRHRGPDAAGFFSTPDGLLKLGHRRLSILDLNPRSNQPMEIDGYVIVYNGEVYNFRDIRSQLKAKCQTTSDTEVVLRAYMEYGVKAFSMFDGMFALAIYDPRKNYVVLARDRMGIKPLYYYQGEGRFTFASEVDVLRAPFRLNLAAVQRYLYQNYIYGTEEIIKDVYRLWPGSYGVFDLNTRQFAVTKYWEPNLIAKEITETAAVQDFLNKMEESVSNSLVSDVPVGVFLSSGNDSALIAALAKKVAGKVKTFTVGFEFSSYDESAGAEKIARVLETDHHAIRLSKDEVIRAIPEILDRFQMPFGDSSAIPVYFLSQFARAQATVCLSGDGADELFGGYPLYYLPKIAAIYNHMPFKKLWTVLAETLPSGTAKMSFDYKLKRFVRGVHKDYRQAHLAYRGMHNDGVLVGPVAENDKELVPERLRGVSFSGDAAAELMCLDQETVLEGDYLVKVDRMSMAHSLEVRVPFLNNKIIDFSNQLPSTLKIKRLTTKFLVKRALESYLPNNLIYQKKQGFSVPMAAWLNDELQDFMVATLSKENVEKTGRLSYSRIRAMIEDHWRGRKDYSRELWGLISLVRYITRFQSDESLNNHSSF